MKAIIFNEYGGPEKLEYVDIPDPQPGSREVLIKVMAASVNPVDWKIREGRLKFMTGKKFPLFAGSELSGVISELGPDVSEFRIGDRVFAGLTRKGGAYAEYVVAKVEKAIRIPDEMSYEVASTLAIAGVTPLQAFTHHFKVKKGNEILVNGGSGGVGTYAIQIAKALGARVTAVCSELNKELVLSLGADEVIDYNKEDFRNRHNAFDVILDAAANAFYNDSKKSLKKGGMLIKLNISVKTIVLGLWTKYFSSRKVKMILLKNSREDLQWMIDHIISGEIKVIIDRTFPLEKAREAQAYSQTGRAKGKIVILFRSKQPITCIT